MATGREILQRIGALDSDITNSTIANRRGAGRSFQSNLGNPSLSNTYKVSLMLASATAGSAGSNLDTWLTSAGVFDNYTPDRFDFLCAETMLPGTRLDIYQELGSRQGILEAFPKRREYTDMAMSFYVSSDYQILRLFQEWINFINPVHTAGGTPIKGSPGGYPNTADMNAFHRFRYPVYYKRDIAVTKFEKNLDESITYVFVGAFPISLNSIPLSYDTAQVMQCQVEFKYDRYFIAQQNKPQESYLAGDFSSIGAVTRSAGRPAELISGGLPASSGGNPRGNSSSSLNINGIDQVQNDANSAFGNFNA